MSLGDQVTPQEVREAIRGARQALEDLHFGEGLRVVGVTPEGRLEASEVSPPGQFGDSKGMLEVSGWEGGENTFLRLRTGMARAEGALFGYPSTMHYLRGPARSQVTLYFEGSECPVGGLDVVGPAEAAQALFGQLKAAPHGAIYIVPAEAEAIRGNALGAVKASGEAPQLLEPGGPLRKGSLGKAEVASTEAPEFRIGGRWIKTAMS